MRKFNGLWVSSQGKEKNKAISAKFPPFLPTLEMLSEQPKLISTSSLIPFLSASQWCISFPSNSSALGCDEITQSFCFCTEPSSKMVPSGFF